MWYIRPSYPISPQLSIYFILIKIKCNLTFSSSNMISVCHIVISNSNIRIIWISRTFTSYYFPIVNTCFVPFDRNNWSIINSFKKNEKKEKKEIKKKKKKKEKILLPFSCIIVFLSWENDTIFNLSGNEVSQQLNISVNLSIKYSFHDL